MDEDKICYYCRFWNKVDHNGDIDRFNLGTCINQLVIKKALHNGKYCLIQEEFVPLEEMIEELITCYPVIPFTYSISGCEYFRMKRVIFIKEK